jgi:hypothetical protein
MIQVGYAQRSRSQVFYLYRDSDTISYEKMIGESDSQVVFGWMFRPVLGRRSVSPGLRQMFAIVSLPEKDGDSSVQLQAHVKTYWKKYDAGTMTAFEERDASRASKFAYSASLGLAKPQIFSVRYQNEADYKGIEVKSTKGYETNLTPVVEAVRWRPVGAKSALITVEGRNFFTGTQVAIGDKTLSGPLDGLILKSNQTFDVLTTLDALANGSGMLVGRYGPAVPMRTLQAKEGCHLDIQQTTVGPDLSGSRALDIQLSDPKKISDLPHDTAGPSDPVIVVNGKVVPPPYTMFQTEEGVNFRVQIASSVAATNGLSVKLSWPFEPECWTATKYAPDPNAMFEIVRVDDKSVVIRAQDETGFTLDRNLRKGPPGFCWKVVHGDKIENLKVSETCDRQTDSPIGNAISKFAVECTFDKIPEKVVLISPWNAAYVIAVPKADASAVASVPKPIALNQYDRVWIEIQAEKDKDFINTSTVEAGQVALPFQPPKKKEGDSSVTKLKVEITQDITAKPGDVDVTVWDTQKTVLGSTKLHITCVDCRNPGGK